MSPPHLTPDRIIINDSFAHSWHSLSQLHEVEHGMVLQQSSSFIQLLKKINSKNNQINKIIHLNTRGAWAIAWIFFRLVGDVLCCIVLYLRIQLQSRCCCRWGGSPAQSDGQALAARTIGYMESTKTKIKMRGYRLKEKLIHTDTANSLGPWLILSPASSFHYMDTCIVNWAVTLSPP